MGEEAGNRTSQSIELRPPPSESSTAAQRRIGGTIAPAAGEGVRTKQHDNDNNSGPTATPTPSTDMRSHGISVSIGVIVIAVFFGMFDSFLRLPLVTISDL